jgi:hypothetical protein
MRCNPRYKALVIALVGIFVFLSSVGLAQVSSAAGSTAGADTKACRPFVPAHIYLANMTAE